MKRKFKRLLCLAAAVFAAVTAVCAAQCSLTVKYQYEGAIFELYHVASITAEGTYEKSDLFEDCPVDVKNINTSNYPTYADTLAGYVMLNSMEPSCSEAIGSDGTLTFSPLEAGLYLLMPQEITVDGKTYTTKPMLVGLPMADETGISWLFDVTVSPKPGEVTLPEDEPISRKVLKNWNDGGNESQRPDSITIYLLKDGEIFDTVELSEEDDWRYRWDDLSAEYSWTVVEAPVPDYHVTVEREGITFLVTNTHKSVPTPKPPPLPMPEPSDELKPVPTEAPDISPSPEITPAPEITPELTSEPEAEPEPALPTLPQTGLLWWPVPVLAAAGLLMVIFGLVRRRGDDDGK